MSLIDNQLRSLRASALQRLREAVYMAMILSIRAARSVR